MLLFERWVKIGANATKLSVKGSSYSWIKKARFRITKPLGKKSVKSPIVLLHMTTAY